MPKKKSKQVDANVGRKVEHTDIHLYTDRMCVEMPRGLHDPLIAAVALFNVKYHGETIRLWFSNTRISNFKMLLQWDLGMLAYKLLTFDAAGTKDFESFNIEALLQLSEFTKPVDIVYCDITQWDADGAAKVAQLLNTHPPINFRVRECTEEEETPNVTFSFLSCGTSGRVTKQQAGE